MNHIAATTWNVKHKKTFLFKQAQEGRSGGVAAHRVHGIAPRVFGGITGLKIKKINVVIFKPKI